MRGPGGTGSIDVGQVSNDGCSTLLIFLAGAVAIVTILGFRVRVRAIGQMRVRRPLILRGQSLR